MSSEIFPRRDLPGLSDVWGRHLEGRVVGLERRASAQEQNFNNSARADAGQLAVLARQIDELQNRRSYQVTPANVAVTGNATIAPFPQATRDWSVPAPVGGTRSAIVFVSGTWTNDGGGSNSVQAFMEVLYGGVVVSRSQGSVPAPVSSPPGWEATANVFFTTRIPAGADPNFTIRITRVGFTATVTTLTLTNIVCTVQYGDKI